MLKKKQFDDQTEVQIFDEALIYLRDDHWQFRMYLPTEKRYVVRSLKTKNRAIAIEKGKDLFHDIRAEVRNDKKLFSKTTKEAVADYIDYRQTDVDRNTIVPGRLATITAHLNHFLDYIKRDTRLRDLEADSASVLLLVIPAAFLSIQSERQGALRPNESWGVAASARLKIGQKSPTRVWV